MSNERDTQNALRLAATAAGARLWRNNVGAAQMADGSWLRFGLANDSPDLNRHMKSSDLIGLRPVLITPGMVGHTIGQFVAREMKAPGWRYTGTQREMAQKAFIDLVVALGGDARFSTGEWV